MEYLKTTPPANPTVEDLQRWVDQELVNLEQVISSLLEEIAKLKES